MNNDQTTTEPTQSETFKGKLKSRIEAAALMYTTVVIINKGRPDDAVCGPIIDNAVESITKLFEDEAKA